MTDCLFCGIVAEKIKANVVFKNDYVVVFKDINPKAPVHLLIIPRKHIAGVLDIEPEDDVIIGQIFQVAAQLADDAGPRSPAPWSRGLGRKLRRSSRRRGEQRSARRAADDVAAGLVRDLTSSDDCISGGQDGG